MSLLAGLLLLTMPMESAELCALTEFPDELVQGSLDAAALDAVIADDPECMPAHFLRGFVHLDDQDNDAEAALVHFERARELEPENTTIMLWMGRVHGKLAMEKTSLGHARSARKLFEEAVETDPDNLDARSALGSYHRGAPWIAGGRIKIAYAQAEEIRKRDLKRGLLEQARTLLADGKEDQARTLARNTLETYPDHVDLALEYAILMHAREEFTEAYRVLQAALDHDDSEAEPMVLYQLGRTAALSGNYIESGRNALQRYLDRDSDDDDFPISPASAWWRLGMIEQHAERIEAARDAFKQALTIDPQFEDAVEALNNLPD